MSFLRFLPDSLKEKLRVRAGAITAQSRLANLRQAGFRPHRIIDAGAFQGDWAKLARIIFPDSQLLLIEPQPHLAAPLQKLCAQLGNATVRSALLGRVPASVPFLIAETNSRIAPADYQPQPGEQIVSLPVRTLADLAAETGFADCDFLKLDLQGHELEALASASDLFGRAEVILTEVSWIPIGNPPLAAEVIATFSAKGYRLYDIFGWNYRPRDHALWQTDLLFVRHDSPLIESSAWA